MTLSTIEKIRKYHSKGRALLYQISAYNEVECSSEGAWVKCESGRKFLDAGSFGKFLVGHAQESIIHSLCDQLRSLPGTSRGFPSVIQADAHEMLVKVSPSKMSKCMLLNSGAEVVDAALKLTRLTTKRKDVVYLEGAYHGKTYGALSVTDSDVFKGAVEPSLENSIKVSRTDIGFAVDVIRKKKPAAVILEPIQGEGGMFVLEDRYIQEMRKVCSEEGVILVSDEIQCGLGRVGVWCAMEHAGVSPDILLLGKSLGAGIVPVSAMVCTESAYKVFDQDPLIHSSTFSANPLACAAVLSTLKHLTASSVEEKARSLGNIITELLTSLVEKWPDLFYGVSGRGLMLGLHCVDAGIAGDFLMNCYSEGLIVTPCLTKPNIIRFTPSIVLTDSDLVYLRVALSNASEKANLNISK